MISMIHHGALTLFLQCVWLNYGNSSRVVGIGGLKNPQKPWFSWVFTHLVGGIPTPLKNDGVRQMG